MAKNLLVINVDIRETRVALIEGGIIAELHLERESSLSTVGNVYVGKVSRVLPGMQAAFIDVGLERAAFLHVEDLIRPDDFDAYLAGHGAARQQERETAPAAQPNDDSTHDLPDPNAGDSTGPDHGAAEGAARATQLEGADESAADDAEILVTSGEAYEQDGGEEADHHHDDPYAEDDDADVDLAELGDGDEVLATQADEDGEMEALDTVDGLAALEVEDVRDVAAAEDAPCEQLDSPDRDHRGGLDDASRSPDAPSLRTLTDAASDAGAPGAASEPPIEPSPGAARTLRLRSGRRARVRRSGHTGERRPQANDAIPAAAEQPSDRRDGGRGGGHGAGRGGRDRSPPPASDAGRDGRRRGRGRARDGRNAPALSRTQPRDTSRDRSEPLRVSKSTPIREVVREGQEVIVQISKESIGTKGARVTSHVSLPGRYVVYLPTVEHVGISKRIGSEKERIRLRESIEAMKPPKGGLIVRTLGEGLTKKQLKQDVGYLVRLWGEIVKKRETAQRAPECLYQELDLVLRTARDLFTDDIEKIVVDDREQYTRLRRFIEIFMPERVNDIELYEGEEPIFDAYGIEDEIARALARKVPLPSGGHLIIDQAEALTAIDVNTGRFVGKGSKDLEDTIFKTNIEAVEEIAYQLRFRNLGGLIILDLIDMERTGNREKVRRHLEQLLLKDKAKTTLNRISDLGLIEMTRKRTRESLGRTILEPCFYCDGTGQLQSKQTIAFEILRQIRRERANLAGYKVVVHAHPAVVDLLKTDEREAVVEAERRFMRRIELVPRKEYHLEQFDLQGK